MILMNIMLFLISIRNDFLSQSLKNELSLLDHFSCIIVMIVRFSLVSVKIAFHMVFKQRTDIFFSMFALLCLLFCLRIRNYFTHFFCESEWCTCNRCEIFIK